MMKRTLALLLVAVSLYSAAWAGPPVPVIPYDPTAVLVSGGTIDGTVIGGTTPAAGSFTTLTASGDVDFNSGAIDGTLMGATKTNVQKGPAAFTTATTPAVTGTVTAAASTTVTFSRAADAILAGYHATNPILGATLISNGLTRYIVSWTNATTCVVDSSVTWAGTAITSVQLPIATFVNSAGIQTGFIASSGVIGAVSGDQSTARIKIHNTGTGGSSYSFIAGRAGVSNGGFQLYNDISGASLFYFDGNSNFMLGGLTAAGTSAAKVLAMGEGTAPTAVIANGTQSWSADRDGVAGDNRLHIMGEKTTATVIIGDGQVEFNAPANGKGTGIVVYRQAGENLVYKDSCYIKTDGKMWKTDADSYTTMPTTRIALETISANAWGLFLEYGYMRDDTWTWTAGGTIYADTTTGAWTQTAVSGQSDVLQIIGVAESATVAKINPSWVTTEIGLDVVTVSSADAAITVSSLTSVPVQYHVTTGNSDRTLTIDAMSAADIGKGIEIYKVDPGGSGKVIVAAPAGVYFVNSAGASTSGGTITSEASKYQMVSLRFISATLIQIKYTDGTWTKSS